MPWQPCVERPITGRLVANSEAKTGAKSFTTITRIPGDVRGYSYLPLKWYETLYGRMTRLNSTDTREYALYGKCVDTLV